MAGLQSPAANVKPILLSPTHNPASCTASPSKGSKDDSAQQVERPDFLAKMAAAAALILLRNRLRERFSAAGPTTQSDLCGLQSLSKFSGPRIAPGGLSHSCTGSTSQRYPAPSAPCQLLESVSEQSASRLSEDELLIVLTEPYLMDWCFR